MVFMGCGCAGTSAGTKGMVKNCGLTCTVLRVLTWHCSLLAAICNLLRIRKKKERKERTRVPTVFPLHIVVPLLTGVVSVIREKGCGILVVRV
jgi:hypothetical protein